MANAPETLDGWYALHSVYRVDWRRWRGLAAADRDRLLADAEAMMAEAVASREGHRGASAYYWVLGHKGDLMAVHLRPTLDDLIMLENAWDKGPFAEILAQSYSYLSVVELSTHQSGGRSEEAQAVILEALRKRLEPELPETPYICFYPMSKLRGEQHNWYLLDTHARSDLMRSHGLIGRSYAGKVKQIITGSMGIDDWEWGVDLFAQDPLQFKKIIYEMRFDEVSAIYALFGSFFVGRRLGPGEIGRYLSLERGDEIGREA